MMNCFFPDDFTPKFMGFKSYGFDVRQWTYGTYQCRTEIFEYLILKYFMNAVDNSNFY